MAAALIALVVVGYAIWHGQSSTPEIPAEMANSDPMSIEALEKKAQDNPNDPTVWATLGLVYFSNNRHEDAVKAYEKATSLDSGRAILWSSLGEAIVYASKKDPLPPAALAAFGKAIAIDPKDPRSRYFLAVKKDLDKDHEGAIKDWLALLEDTPADAPWRADLIRTIEQVGKIQKMDVAARIAAAGGKSPPAVTPVVAQAIPGPTQADLRNAASIPPAQQQQMAEGMVASLEAKLKSNPKNVDGWIMLMRSRMTLGEPQKASEALKTAVAANPDRAADLRQQAGILGVK